MKEHSAAPQQAAIGLFDSGIGGMSIVLEVQRLLPAENLIFVADQVHVPYGSRSLEDVRRLSFGIVDYLLEQDAKLIVVACNTASAASLHELRARYPQTPFVGMEPAVKPAAEISHTQTVGILATPATFQGELFASVVERFAEGVTVLQETLPGLVEQIEKGELQSLDTRRILEAGVLPLIEQGADTLVLACTHFPFIIPLLEEIVGKGVNVIDPAPAVARQVARLLDHHGLRNPHNDEPSLVILTTGESVSFNTAVQELDLPHHDLVSGTWLQGRLTAGRIPRSASGP